MKTSSTGERSTMRRAVRRGLAACTVAWVLVACGGSDSATTTEPPVTGGGAAGAAGKGGASGATTCPAGQKVCGSTCEPTNQPAHGCGKASCDACPANATSCALGACYVPGGSAGGGGEALPPFQQGTGGAGTTVGVCGTTTATADSAVNQCLTAHCCSSFTACIGNHNCDGCLTDTGGIDCDTDALLGAFISCGTENCIDATSSGGAGGEAGAGGRGVFGGGGNPTGGSAGSVDAGAGGTGGSAAGTGGSGGSLITAGSGGSPITAGSGGSPITAGSGGSPITAGSGGSGGNPVTAGSGGSTTAGAGGATVICNGSQTACGSICVDTTSDPNNCSACGAACNAGEKCTSSKCTNVCATALTGTPITDAWGAAWDGNERVGTDFASAAKDCSNGGGRLPTISELYRVSVVRTKKVGSTLTTNALWSETPAQFDPSGTVSYENLNLGTGVVTMDVATDANAYRCVCPTAPQPGLTGSECNGKIGAACSNLSTEGKRVNIDQFDRPAVTTTAATWECLQLGAHLVSATTLIEAIRDGLPNGSSTPIHTSDGWQYDNDNLIEWAGIQKAWTPTAVNLSTDGYTGTHPFRCVGTNFAEGVNPNTFDGSYQGHHSDYLSDSIDNPVSDLTVAMDRCVDLGGHLSRSAELDELIFDGLPNGSGTQVLTSDEAANVGGFLVQTVGWGAQTPPAYDVTYNGGPLDRNWSYRNTPGTFRCTYYTLDASYMGPAASVCNGGCFSYVEDGDPSAIVTPVMMWADNKDRPAAAYEVAISTCYAAGGHLASQRDLIELVRQGLGGGNTTGIWAADLVNDTSTSAGKIIWSDVDPSLADTTTYATDAPVLPGSQDLAYRCVWTNELR